MGSHQAEAAEQVTRCPACKRQARAQRHFWVLRSGAPWRDLPKSFGPYTKPPRDRSMDCRARRSRTAARRGPSCFAWGCFCDFVLLVRRSDGAAQPAKTAVGLLRLVVSGDADRLVVIGRIEFGTIGAPSAIFDDAVDLAQPRRSQPQRHDLPDPHHYVPADDFNT